MNGKERIFALIEGKPVDHVPFCSVMSLYGGKLVGQNLKTYYTDPKVYADGQAEVVETFHPDVVSAPFLVASIGEAFGGELRFFDDQPPNLAAPPIQSVHEIKNLVEPDIDSHPSIVYLRESLREIARAHGEQSVIVAPILGPFDMPIMLMGLNGWLETVLTSPDDVKRMVDFTTPFFMKLLDALLKDGLHVPVLPSPFLLPTVLPRELVKKSVLPTLKTIYAGLPSPVVLHSVGAPFVPFLDLLGTLPGVAGAVIDEGEDMAKARDILGPDAILFAGLDGGRLFKLDEETIRTKTRRIIEERRGDPKFIFTATGPDVGWRTPPSNIHAMAETVAKSGAC